MNRIDRAKESQDYEPDPPRCWTCVYFVREPVTRFIEKTVKKGGRMRTIKVPARHHPTMNPLVDRCTFGNFGVKPHGVCNEWHSRQGERIETAAQPHEGE